MPYKTHCIVCVFLFMDVKGFHCCTQAFFNCSKGTSHCSGFSCRTQALEYLGSVVVAHGLSCSRACGIFPDEGSNPCPLNWQVDS